ncbi:hypothetical protein BLJAPNOD_06249 [Ensifer sp. M14]|nr:hypothetical protein BLJAPNOD_06249 [Ensifer sp. M14]
MATNNRKPYQTAWPSPGPAHDWDPRSPQVQQNQIRAYDQMREECPVAHSDYLGWSLFRHQDVLQVLGDHETFSNVVSLVPRIAASPVTRANAIQGLNRRLTTSRKDTMPRARKAATVISAVRRSWFRLYS